MKGPSTYFSQLQIANQIATEAFIRVGQIVKTLFIDDPLNISKKYVEYNVVVYDNEGRQTPLQNIRSAADFSSTNDYSVRVLEDTQVATKGALADDTIPRDKNGSYVLVAFLNGMFSMPLILTSIDHPGIEGTATVEKGIHASSVYRGLKQTINKHGELELVFTGAKMPDGRPVIDGQVPVTIKIGKDNTMEHPEGHAIVISDGEDSKGLLIKTAAGQLIQLSDVEGEESFSILHKQGAIFSINKEGGIQIIGADGSYFFLNADANEISLTHKDGHVVSMTGDGITIADKGGADIINVTGDKIQLTSGGDVAMQASAIGGNAGTVEFKDQVGATLNLSGGKVALGNATVEVMDVLSQLLDQLSKEAPPGFGTPLSGAPLYISLKALVDAAKGSL